MNYQAAANKLGDELEVDIVRYPMENRISHLNEAMDLLSRKYQVRIDEYTASETILAAATSVPLSRFITTNYEPEVIEQLIWIDSSGNETELLEGSIRELNRNYTQTGTGTPEAFSQHGGRVYVRPIPEEDGTLYAVVRGHPVASAIASSTPEWLRVAPYPVIYKAAEIASLWLSEDWRVPRFRELRLEHMEAVNLADAGRNDGPRESQEA